MAGDERTNRKKSTGEMSEFLREEEVRVEQEGNDLNNAYFYKISPVIVEIRKEGIEL
jgi:hypothetical protein